MRKKQSVGLENDKTAFSDIDFNKLGRDITSDLAI